MTEVVAAPRPNLLVADGSPTFHAGCDGSAYAGGVRCGSSGVQVKSTCPCRREGAAGGSVEALPLPPPPARPAQRVRGCPSREFPAARREASRPSAVESPRLLFDAHAAARQQVQRTCTNEFRDQMFPYSIPITRRKFVKGYASGSRLASAALAMTAASRRNDSQRPVPSTPPAGSLAAGLLQQRYEIRASERGSVRFVTPGTISRPTTRSELLYRYSAEGPPSLPR